MPVVPQALAEIEGRLEEIRHRLNRRTLFAALCPLAAALLVLASLLVWSALRANPESFTMAVYATAGAAALLVIWAALRVAGGWLSLAAAAQVADERGGMQERLSTVLWLARSGAPAPPLAPVLVADTLARRDAWKLATIAPRRVPFEVAYPIAALALLLGVALFAQRVPPPLEEQLAAMPPAERQMEMAVPLPPPPPPRRDEHGEPLLEPHPMFAEGGSESVGALGESGDRAEITQQLRSAIRRALARYEQSGATSELAGGADGAGGRKPGEDGEQAEGGQEALRLGARDLAGAAGRPQSRGEDGEQTGDAAGGEELDAAHESRRAALEAEENAGDVPMPQGRNDRPRDPRRAVEADDYRPEAGDERAASMPGQDEPPGSLEGRGTRGGRETEDPSSPEPRPQPDVREAKGDPNAAASAGEAGVAGGDRRGGASAAAGASGDPQGLFAAPGSAAAGAGGARPPAGTFKLTLGSFLAASGGGTEKPRAGERIAVAGARSAVAEPPALHPDQSADDVLRRADVPPEYEEIVRRIFSSRPAR